MPFRPRNIVDSLTYTFTARAEGTANTLYSGSLSALTSHGFLVKKIHGSKSFTITLPLASGSKAATNLTAMKAYLTNVSGSVLIGLRNELTALGTPLQDAITQTTPDSKADYSRDQSGTGGD